MDENKREVLKDAGYQVHQACGRCIYSDIRPNQDWGTCTAIVYFHQKHTESQRQLSIHRYGSCERGFVPKSSEDLGGFKEFT